MTWRDKIKVNSVDGAPLQGSFRGARFIVPQASLEFGRRVQVHEYPLRDEPYTEDLGRKARRFQVEVFVDGADYLAARDALIEAIEKPGPGTLVHPWYGTRRVAVVEARVRESSRDGGRATFSLTFVEAGEAQLPTSQTDTAAAVTAAADALETEAVADFTETFAAATEGKPAWVFSELEGELDRTLGELTRMVGDVAGPIAAAIRTPGNMAVALIGAIGTIESVATEPLRALNMYSNLFGAGSSSPSVPTTTGTRKGQARAADAMQQLTRRAALCGACRSAASTDFTARVTSDGVTASRDDALSIRAQLLDALDDQMEATDPVSGAPLDDGIYQALAALRSAVAEDLRTRGAQLPSITIYTPKVTLPALVVAHQVHGDATRADEIAARNGVRNPGFVAGGSSLEVLSA